MKEQSIEEKAKRYDEAIEKARLVLQEKGNEPDGASILSKLFPELIESEDERIRKELLNYLYDVHDDDEERARWIAWLEKQAEQKPAWSEEIEIAFTDICENCCGRTVELVKNIMQPKQEWSEEDNRRLNKIEIILRHSISSSNEDISWLKSLRPQNTWKPSKEQLQALRWVCNRTFIAQEPQKESALEDLYEQLMAL